MIRILSLLFMLPCMAVTAQTEFIEPPMVSIPAGEFMMGSEHGRADEKPVHKVNIKAFMLAKYEVTVKEFKLFMRDNPLQRTGKNSSQCWSWGEDSVWQLIEGNWQDSFNAPSDYHPVMCISYAQANAYIDWLKSKTGKPYRLATEAEWEYAARAGSNTQYYFGDNPKQLCEYANSFDISGKKALKRDFGRVFDTYAPCDDGSEFTSVVGLYKPNQFGLYDMLGNVGEMTSDCKHDSYVGAPTDGSSWQTDCIVNGTTTVVISRGGAYGITDAPDFIRTTARWHWDQDNENGSSVGEGFRIAMDIEPERVNHQASISLAFEQQLANAQQQARAKFK